MAGQTETTSQQPDRAFQDHLQRRYTIAALVYFLYGLFYLFGAQYFTGMQGMQAAARGMSNPERFFVIGIAITILFPLLIYKRFALALPFYWHPSTKTLFINFTSVLGLAVILRALFLWRNGHYMKSPLHTAALIVTVINAACLIWASMSRPLWVVHALDHQSRNTSQNTETKG
jgi:hypothetical protein